MARPKNYESLADLPPMVLTALSLAENALNDCPFERSPLDRRRSHEDALAAVRAVIRRHAENKKSVENAIGKFLGI